MRDWADCIQALTHGFLVRARRVCVFCFPSILIRDRQPYYIKSLWECSSYFHPFVFYLMCFNWFSLTLLIHSVSLSALFKKNDFFVCFQKAPKGQSRVERLRKKMNEQESWLLLHSPTIPFRIHNKHGKVLCPPPHPLYLCKPHYWALTTRWRCLSNSPLCCLQSWLCFRFWILSENITSVPAPQNDLSANMAKVQ